MVINVTQAHINEGTPSQAFSCPVSIAVNEILGDGFEVGVGGAVCVYERHGKLLIHADMSGDLIEWLRSYDRGDTVQPTSFELPIDELLNG